MNNGYIRSIIGILCSLFCLMIMVAISCSNETKFDTEKWKKFSESESTHYIRWPMVNDLISNYDLVGMSKQEIFLILGKSTTQKANIYTYDLGPTGNGINYGCLILTTRNDRVVNLSIVEH